MDPPDGLAGGAIRSLPASTSRLLCSGQVATCVSAVVKELVENAIDARAKRVCIRLANYGLDIIEVKDDGRGMTKDELLLAAQPHTTSKLVSFDQLSLVSTYGFRGEALAAIRMAATRLEIASRKSDNDVGYKVAFGQGLGSDPQAAVMNPGTVITVRDVFSSVPVRRKLYNSKARKKEDLRRTEKLCLALAIINPYLDITLLHDDGGGVLVRKSACPNLSQSVRAVLAEFKLTRIDMHVNDVKLTAFMPAEISSKSTHSGTDRTFLFANGRHIEDKMLYGVLRRVTSNVLMAASSRNPVSVLAIEAPKESFDVNLDPGKTTMLIKDIKEVCQGIETKLSEHFGLLETHEDENAGDKMNDSALIDKGLVVREGENDDKDDENDSSMSCNESADDSFGLFESSTSDKVTAKEGPGSRPRPGIPKKDVPVVLRTILPAPSSSDETHQSSFSTASVMSQPERKMIEGTNFKQQTLNPWSSGRALKDADGAPLIPVQLCSGGNAPTERRRRAVEDIFTPDASSKRSKSVLQAGESRLEDFLSRMEHKRKEIGGGPSGDVGRSVASSAQNLDSEPLREVSNQDFAKSRQKKSRHVKVLRPVRNIKFNINRLFMTEQQSSAEKRKVPMEVVGRLANCPFWVFCHEEGGEKSSLHILNHWRVREWHLYCRLLQTYSLQSRNLQEPVDCKVPEGLVCALRDLSVDENGNFMDERVIKNGLIVKNSANEDSTVIIVSVPSSINNMSPVDFFLELLELVSLQVGENSSDLTNFRPSRLRSFLLAEAVRMSRESPPGLSLSEAEEMAGELATSGQTVSCCPHGRTFYTQICNLKELSQA